jgi:hypothetical protein
MENVMENFSYIVRTVAMVLALSLSCEAVAQTDSVHLKANFGLLFDCERPFQVRNHPIRAEFTAVLNADKSASADLLISGVIFKNTVHFDARLGSASQPAPGGTSSLRVIARNRVRAIWDLPNNQFILDLTSAGRSCSAKLNIKLKPGMHEYSMFDGNLMYYCSKQKLQQTTCQAN